MLGILNRSAGGAGRSQETAPFVSAWRLFVQHWVRWMLVLGCLTAAGIGRAAPEPTSAEELVARLEATAASLQDYEVNGEGVADGKHDRYKLYYKRPDLVRIDAKDGEVAVQPNGAI